MLKSDGHTHDPQRVDALLGDVIVVVGEVEVEQVDVDALVRRHEDLDAALPRARVALGVARGDDEAARSAQHPALRAADVHLRTLCKQRPQTGELVSQKGGLWFNLSCGSWNESVCEYVCLQTCREQQNACSDIVSTGRRRSSLRTLFLKTGSCTKRVQPDLTLLTWHAFVRDEKVVAVSALGRQIDPGRVEDARLVADAGRVARLVAAAEVAVEGAAAARVLTVVRLGDLHHVARVAHDRNRLPIALVQRAHVRRCREIEMTQRSALRGSSFGFV